MENNKDMFHQFGARMNSHRRNSTKSLEMNSHRRNSTQSLEEAGRIQHLLQIGFNTGISRT